MSDCYKKVCTECGALIAQCRCDNGNPLLLKGICEVCLGETIEKENEIVERIKEGCKCGYCHGSISDGVGLRCACTEECKALTRLRANEQTALGYFSSNVNTPYEALAWFACANLAKKIKLSRKALYYGNMGIGAYEKIGSLHDAKEWSEIFKFTELAEYYQKLIDLKTSRPK